MKSLQTKHCRLIIQSARLKKYLRGQKSLWQANKIGKKTVFIVDKAFNVV